MQNNKQSLHQTQNGYQHKNYLNYINFQSTTAQKNSSKDIPRQPEQIATYSINISQHPRSGTPNLSHHNINRNAYLSSTVEPRRQPPKQHLLRNGSYKESHPPHQSQQFMKNQSQFSKNSSKTFSHEFPRQRSQADNLNKGSEHIGQKSQMTPSSYSKTIDLGSIKSNKNDSSISPEEDELKQKLNYLQVIQQSLTRFENTHAASELRQLNQDNRSLMLGVFQEIRRLKEERKRRTLNDCVSQSDNFSEDGYSIDDRSESRSNSIHNKTDKRRYMEGLSRSRQKYRAKQKQLQQEKKITEKLKEQYQKELKRLNSDSESELLAVSKAIEKQEQDIVNMKKVNQELAQKLTTLPFHHQWKIMCAQAEGAKKARIKIEDQIIKRKEKLQEVNTSAKKNQIRSEETSAYQKQQQKGRQGQINSEVKKMGMKLPPSGGRNPNQSGGSNQLIPESSSKPPIPQGRSKSSNRYNTSG